MATGGLAVIRRNLVYIGAAKQSAWGTAVAPTWFWKWLNGTKEEPMVRIETVREGDTSRFKTLAYKSIEYRKVTIVEKARPIIAGYALQALMGTGSDAYVAPTKNTTLAASVSAGATTFQSTADLGNASTMVVGFSTAYASAAYEVQTVNLASRSGAGPYTYTLANSATFANAHTNGDGIANASTHAFTVQPYTFDPYTLEFGYGNASVTPARALRVRDAVCTELRIVMDAGKAVEFQHTWYGSVGVIQAGFTAPTFDTSPPFLFYQGGANWKINNANSGNATTIKRLEIDIKAGTTPEDLVNESLNPAYFLPGAVDVTGQMQVHFTSWQEYDQAYYGTSAAATSATDSAIIGFESLGATLAPDALNSFAITLPTVYYSAATLDPNEDAKPLEQAIAFEAIRTAAQPTPITVTLTNNQVGAY